MKFTFVVPFLISLGFSNLFFCQSIQSEKITTDGVFEKVFNRFGDSIALSKIIIDPKDGVTQKALGPLCSSGYFDLYFEIGSGMEGNSTVELARRAVICQVFSDLSQFIQTPNPNVHVNILIKNINTELPGYNPSINSNPSATSNVLGLASAYYLAPSVNSTTTGGIIDNEVWKTINTGVDSYSGVMSPFLLDPTNQNNFGLYHGYMAINFNNPTINWHTDLSQNTSTGLYDLYTVVLHEVTHALGFASLIDENGNSKFGVGYPYYSRFDKFLHTNTNIPIILNQGNCSMYSFGLNPNLNSSVLHPIAQDCSNQIRYIGAINQAAYTPAVFENGSSLSHLFDECHLPNYYTINEYYTMSYANGTGLVYMKRYLKPEERSVLCDLGYQVNSSFGNPNNLNYYDYNSTTCTGLGVYGVNDGIDVNGFVEFITPVNNPNGPTFSGIVSNDINADHFECLQVVYGNGIPSTTSGTSFQFYSTTPGFVVLRYIPVSSSNIRGNITYVYVYVSQSNCTPTTCNYVNNGDFELTTDCGEIGSSPLNNTACWIPYTCSPDLFLRNCTNPFSTWGTTFDIPATYASNNPFEAWNGFINNSFMGMGSNVYNYHESIQTKLNIPLLNGHIYKISLYARCGDNYGAPILPLGYNGELLIGGAVSQLSPTCSPQTIAPSGIVQLGDIFAVANDLNWHHLEQTFQYNGQVNLNQLIIYNYSNISQLNGFHNVYLYIDQVEITEVQPNLNLNLPSSICLNQQINDLSIYAPVSGGYFNGPGITLSGNTYSFNPSLAGIGIHTISYTYTNNLNCTISIEDEIEVINSNFTISATTNNSSICIGQDVLLSANSSTPATYTWNPGNIPGPVLIATPNTSTLYTLTATSNQGCVENLSIPVTVNPLPNIQVNPEITTICEGQSVQLSASGAESYVWSPNNYLSNLTGSVTTASPTSSFTYTVMGTTTSGCSSSATISINVNPLPSIQISPINPTICSGDFVTFTATGAESYNWDPIIGLSSTTGASVIGTPSTNIIYTVTGTSLNGCTNSASTQVEVIPVPSFEITPVLPVICQGNQVTLTANGSFTYDWSPSIGLSNITGSSVVASPTSTTLYTVQGTNSSGCSSSQTINVSVIPLTTITVTPSNPTICYGEEIMLTASGAELYSWTPSAGLSSVDNPNVIANPTSTTSYLISGQNSLGCEMSGNVTVTVNPLPVVTIESSNNYLCAGQQAILTASGSMNFVWSPVTTLTNIINQTATATPTMTTTYSVTGIDANGCSNNAQINLIVVPCNDCNDGILLSGNITTSPTVETTLKVANDIIINGNISFSGNNVKIMPGVKITVSQNSTLTLNGTHLYGCQSMWKGIIVEDGGRVILQPYTSINGTQFTTLIEDANIGIDFKPINNPQSNIVLLSNNTTFNRNKTSIQIQSYPFDNPSSVFIVKNCLFTSRNIYSQNTSTWPLTSAIKSTFSNSNSLLSPYIPSLYNSANLKTPLNTIQAQVGLEIKNIGTTNISVTSTYNSIVIGSLISNEYNVFDYLNVGINSLNSNLKVQNTIFQTLKNITSNNIDPNIFTPTEGCGIACKSEPGFNNKLDVAGQTNLPNQFFGLSLATFTDNLSEVFFNKNIVRSNRPDFQNTTYNIVGQRGVYIKENINFKNLQVTDNIFYSIKRGISLIANIAEIAPNINFSNNIFQFKPGIASGNVISDHGILIQNSNSTNSMGGGNILVNNNTITNVKNGIKVTSWRKISLQINANTISFREIGIGLEYYMQGTAPSQITNNSLIGSINFNPNPGIGDPPYQGISLNSSIGNVVSCNSVSNSYSGLYFHSNCNPTKTSRNSMSNNKYGFVLDNNGIIGQQGTLTNPADNMWLGNTWDQTNTTNGEFKTACLNGSNAINSKMYVRNTSSIYSPQGSTPFTNNNLQYNFNFPQLSLLLAPNSPAPTSCTIISNPPVNALTTSDIIDAIESVASQINDTLFSSQQDALLIDEIFRALETDTTLLQNSFSLTAFYDIIKITNTGILYDVERLAKDSTQYAEYINDSILPENQVEENYKIFYEAYLNYNNNNFSQQDSLTIISIAQGCPTLQGSAVYLAEALFNFVYIQDSIFIQTCPEHLEKSSYDESTTNHFEQFVIYPIPNNGKFIVKGPLKKGQKLDIISIENKQLSSVTLNENTDVFEMKLDLGDGVYFLILKDELNFPIFRKKFIIVK
jgi:hypothetical protein